MEDVVTFTVRGRNHDELHDNARRVLRDYFGGGVPDYELHAEPEIMAGGGEIVGWLAEVRADDYIGDDRTAIRRAIACIEDRARGSNDENLVAELHRQRAILYDKLRLGDP